MSDQPPGAMMRWQPELPLWTMSVSMAVQRWVLMSVVHITIREHGMSLVRAYAQELGRTGPALHWLLPSGELVPSLTSSTGEIRPCASLGQHSGPDPGGCGVWVSRPSEHECGRADPATCLPWGSLGAEGNAPLVHPSNSSESCPQGHEFGRAILAPHWLQHLGEWALHPTWTAQQS